MKAILKFIGDALLFTLAVTIFLILVSVLAIGVTFLVAVIGRWIGIGQDIFIYVTLFVAYWKAWDFLTWIVDRIIIYKIYKKEEKLRKK